MKENHGIIGDAHAGSWHRQISLLAQESVDEMRRTGLKLHAGDFAENILTEGIDLKHLPVGTVLRVGKTRLQVTQIGKECHSDCAIKKAVANASCPRRHLRRGGPGGRGPARRRDRNCGGGSMKLIRTEDAVGHVLCHDLTQIIPGVTKDARFRKGHVVTKEDIPVLLSLGKDQLYVWEKAEGMLHEDEAAEILCAICRGEYMDRSAPKEGKIELTAACSGLFKIKMSP
mgnify:CR=1 FL=1